MEDTNPRLLAVGTAVPTQEIDQATAKRFIETVMGGGPPNTGSSGHESPVALFDRIGVERRAIVASLDWISEPHSFGERNVMYAQRALELAARAAGVALQRSAVDPQAITGLVLVTNTGWVPGLQFELVHKLGLGANLGGGGRRIRAHQMTGRGCAEGVAGIAAAMEEVRVDGTGPMLVVAVELPSLLFQANDLSAADVAAASLFGDGAGAAVVCPAEDARGECAASGSGLHLISRRSRVWPGTTAVKGLSFADDGPRVVMDGAFTEHVRTLMPAEFESAWRQFGVAAREIKHLLVDCPGEPAAHAFEEALNLDAGSLNYPRGVLRDHGSTAAASIFFLLERFLEGQEEPTSNELGILCALGPGLSAELLLFRT